MDSTGGPIIRYIFLSVFALLLITACGSNVDKLKETNACVKCDLSGADLRVANLVDADLTRADLVDADLTGANLTGAYLTGADLTEANLTRADLTEANLNKAFLKGANFDGATGADFTGAWNVPTKYLKD